MNNPLHQYMRSEKLYVSLPTAGYYYDDSVIEFTENKEVGIMPMTVLDEIALNTPDALLNGDGIKKAIMSCVPAIKDPTKILMNDFDILLLAIRKASYGDSLEFEDTCPECKHKNEYTASISSMLDSVETIDPPFMCELETGLIIHVKSLSFKSTTTMALKALETNRILQSITMDNIDKDENLIETLREKYNRSIESIAELSITTLQDGIHFIQTPKGENINDPKMILDFLYNLDKKSIDIIQEAIHDIPTGYDKNINVECEECEHKWESFVEFNPTNFFGEGS